jgi:hypothetical protein
VLSGQLAVGIHAVKPPKDWHNAAENDARRYLRFETLVADFAETDTCLRSFSAFAFFMSSPSSQQNNFFSHSARSKGSDARQLYICPDH